MLPPHEASATFRFKCWKSAAQRMHMPMGQSAAKPKARARATPRWTVRLAPSPPPGMSSIVEAAGDLLTELNEEEEERTRTTRRNSTMQRWKPPWMWLWSSP